MSDKVIVNKKCTLHVSESFFLFLVAFIIIFHGPGNVSKLTVPKLLKFFIFNERRMLIEFTTDFPSIVQHTLNLCLKKRE
jgi:hypothetical protein